MSTDEKTNLIPFDPLDDACDCVHPAAVAHAREHLADEQQLLEAADMFTVLGDPTRLRVITSLLHGELCVTDIAVATGVNRTTISHQLRVLRTNSLVKRRREGKVVYYSISNDTLTHVLELVAPGICSVHLQAAAR